ncbi:hypothetical protein SH661x_001059 [Planctomicrobium sp. SH661]|uniref:hypothetical protein n=1 Tax=Planctomicrobium sp. SH661 TaxID=3448124 RepID=UPI003F5C98AD
MAAVKTLGGTFNRGSFRNNVYKDDPASAAWRLQAQRRTDIRNLSPQEIATAIASAISANSANFEKEKADAIAAITAEIETAESRASPSKDPAKLKKFKADQKQEIADLKRTRTELTKKFVPSQLADLERFDIGTAGQLRFKTIATQTEESQSLNALWIDYGGEKHGLLIGARQKATEQSEPVVVVGEIERFSEKRPVLQLLSDSEVNEAARAR